MASKTESADGRHARESFTDKTGREVLVGDRIVYGHALGRSAGLRFGKVLSIETVKREYARKEEWAIRVQGVDDDWSHCEASLTKPGILQYPNRIVLVNGLVPAAQEKLLSGEPDKDAAGTPKKGAAVP